MNERWAGTRAGREWRATPRGLRDALDAIAAELKRLNDQEGEIDERRDDGA